MSQARIAEYEGSDLHERIALQRELDRDRPLRDALFPHTHNSFNSEFYTPSLSRLDNNQILSLKDQLRLDMRAIEIDIHRAPSLTEGKVGVVACHAQEGGGTLVHPGCTNEEPLSFYLAQLRSWLDANPTQFVILYLENGLDGDLAAHDEAAANIDEHLGDLVVRTSTPCADMPYSASQASLRPAQVLIVGNCGPGAWGTYVHDRGPEWDETSNPAGDDYDCAADRSAHDYETEIPRRYEDRTWLSVMVDPDGEGGGITTSEMSDMVRCGVNLVGFDMLHPNDPRLRTLVWTWAPDEPSAPGCALQVGDGHWVSRSCGEQHRAACFAGGEWTVTADPVTYADAAAACAFDRPWNGWENSRLLDVSGGDVWVAWSDAEVAPQ